MTGIERDGLVLVKLGGSLITDKARPETPRPETLVRLAREISQGLPLLRGRVVVGHGGGSFGHPHAARHRLQEGLEGEGRVEGATLTRLRMLELHKLVLEAFVDAGLSPFSFAPSSAGVASKGRIRKLDAEPVILALRHGFVPVLFGDVFLDRTRGVRVCSTEEVFRTLARRLAGTGLPVRRILWMGDTPGLLGVDGAVVPLLRADGTESPIATVEGAAVHDVTGGMAHRVRVALALAREGIPSLILDGREPGRLESALKGEEPPGTRVESGARGGPDTTPALDDELQSLLDETSRTFALAIPLLPEKTRRAVATAYLLFRIADTFEDGHLWPRDRRLAALDDLRRLLADPDEDEARRLGTAWARDRPIDHPGYIRLLQKTPLVLGAMVGLPEPQRRAVCLHAGRTAREMARFVTRVDDDGVLRLADVSDLRSYCYAVAGIVGELLTDLFLHDAPSLASRAAALRKRAPLFGEALQLVNILRDAWDDAREGRIFVPGTVSRDELFRLARADLEAAKEYTVLLEEGGAHPGIVAFTRLPRELAVATLDLVEERGPGVKVPRTVVARIMQQVG